MMQYNLVQTENLSDDEIRSLGTQLKSNPNNKELKDYIITSFIGIASSIALNYHRTSRLDSDDLQGEALLAIVDAVNRFTKIEHDNLRGYVTIYIHQYCLRYIKKFTNSSISSGNLDQICFENEEKHVYSVAADYFKNLSKTDYLFDILELEDMLDFIIQTERERRIVELRKSGLDDAQVAERLGICRQTVNYDRKRLLARFKRLCND